MDFFLAVDASQAGEGNLEITISARGRNIPTKVHPQGSARFAVSFVPLEAIDHVITITFNKEAVPGKFEFNIRENFKEIECITNDFLPIRLAFQRSCFR